MKKSQLYKNLASRYKGDPNEEVYMNSLKPDYIAEKALMYLFNEQNLVSEDMLVVLADNRRPVSLDQGLLF